MRLQRNSLALSTGLQRPLDDSSIDAATSRAGRTLALILTVLVILLMVVL
jgi:hypothetical protein